MLSREAHALTRLILVRQSLICHALELDAKIDVMALLAVSESVAEPDVAPVPDRGRAFREMCSELELMPGLLEHLEFEISVAWNRLDQVSGRGRP